MLKGINRLRKKKEFSYIYHKGETYYTKFLTLYVAPTKLKNIRIGFSVSNKLGNSVVRHKIKRRLSEITRPKIKELPHLNYIFVAKKGIEELNFLELKKEVESVLQKVKK